MSLRNVCSRFGPKTTVPERKKSVQEIITRQSPIILKKIVDEIASKAKKPNADKVKIRALFLQTVEGNKLWDKAIWMLSMDAEFDFSRGLINEGRCHLDT